MKCIGTLQSKSTEVCHYSRALGLALVGTRKRLGYPELGGRACQTCRVSPGSVFNFFNLGVWLADIHQANVLTCMDWRSPNPGAEMK